MDEKPKLSMAVSDTVCQAIMEMAFLVEEEVKDELEGSRPKKDARPVHTGWLAHIVSHHKTHHQWERHRERERGT